MKWEEDAMETIGNNTAGQNEFIRAVREASGGNLKRYKIETFGCQMNENDSEKLAGMLREMGWAETHDINESDLIIYNTCCVREHAESKVYSRLGELRKIKKNKPDLIIAVCGCMTQQKQSVEYIKKTFSHVDIVFGTHNLHMFPEFLYKNMCLNEKIADIREAGPQIIEGVPMERRSKIKAWITIMYGCNNFCSYCIVPYVRGRERSRNPQEILNEAMALAAEGYKEITLLGQNVNSYGKDLKNGTSFAGLLYRLDRVPGIERIRFMTSHPKDLSGEIIQAMRECSKVCEHLHLPIQAGSNHVLKEMNRKYTKERYMEIVAKIREQVPGISITTDIIVGFPGETDEDFEETMDVIQKVRFDAAYTFIYSKRAGTPAAKSLQQVPYDIKKKRFDRLVKVQNMISREINESLLGSRQEILVEGPSKKNQTTYTGRTRTNKVVNFKGSQELVGRLVEVEITKPLTWYLEGKL